jgi:hypothetical protein
MKAAAILCDTGARGYSEASRALKADLDLKADEFLVGKVKEMLEADPGDRLLLGPFE